MLRENDIKNVRKLFNRHHYVMTTAEPLDAKLYYADIKQLLDEGFIERIRRGYYHWIENCETSEVVIINSLFPDAVLCMETALFYYKYSDRNPAEWSFAIDKNISKLRTNIDYPFIASVQKQCVKAESRPLLKVINSLLCCTCLSALVIIFGFISPQPCTCLSDRCQS